METPFISFLLIPLWFFYKNIQKLIRHYFPTTQISSKSNCCWRSNSRPSSIIKELIENSIDANAKNIKVIIKDAKQSVTVIDDGIGMTKEDAIKCFGRHSTSKLSKAEDLFKIKTMGFR